MLPALNDLEMNSCINCIGLSPALVQLVETGKARSIQERLRRYSTNKVPEVVEVHKVIM